MVRTYRSDRDGIKPSAVTEDFAPYLPGAPTWRPFGRGSTHSLDIRFEEGVQSFSGKLYKVIYLSLGFDTVVFQRCEDGRLLNSHGDGSRLSVDGSFSADGYKYETSDGDALFFQKLPGNTSSGWYCTSRYSRCGILRRWIAPNGDRADFSYEQFFSSQTNRPDAITSGTLTNSPASITTQNECHVTTQGSNVCHNVMAPVFYTTIESGVPPIPSYPFYDQRLTQVTTNRGYSLSFTYVDQSVDNGFYCPSSSTFSCTANRRNARLERSRVSGVALRDVSRTGSPVISSVTYRYGDRPYGGNYSADYLTDFTAVDGRETHYRFTDARSFAIFRGGDTLPSITVKFVDAKSGYFYPSYPRDYYVQPQKMYRMYDRTERMIYADGAVVSYMPTLRSKWIPEEYGTWDWREYVDAMSTRLPDGAVIGYQFSDGSDDHDQPTSVSDQIGRTWQNNYDISGGLISRRGPEGNSLVLTRDKRGNIVTEMYRTKTGMAQASLYSEFSYVEGPSLEADQCVNIKVCNKVRVRTDPRLNQTRYDWDASSGLLKSTTGPIVVGGQSSLITAFRDFAGALGTSVRLPVSEVRSIDASSSVLTAFDYTSPHLFLNGSSVKANGVTLRTCYGYDAAGNRVSETRPRAGPEPCS